MTINDTLYHTLYLPKRTFILRIISCLEFTNAIRTVRAQQDVTTVSFKMVSNFDCKFSWLKIVDGACAVSMTFLKVFFFYYHYFMLDFVIIGVFELKRIISTRWKKSHELKSGDLFARLFSLRISRSTFLLIRQTAIRLVRLFSPSGNYPF